MATVTLTGNADQIRLALEHTVGTLTQASGRPQSIIIDDTPSSGFVVKVTGADGVVRQF